MRLVHGSINCPTCQTQFEISLTAAPQHQARVSAGHVGELLTAIDDKSLDERTLEFVTTTRERYNQYGEKIILSEKQESWLKRIAAESSGDPELPF